MKAYYQIAIYVIIISLAACNSADEKTHDKKTEPIVKPETVSQAVINLSGLVYHFGPDLDSVKCEVLVECDCCSDDFLFLNEKDFIRVGYCIAEKTVIKGTYTASQDDLTLQYDSLTYFTEADDNNKIKTVSKGRNEYLIKSEKVKPVQDILTKFNCKETLFYKNTRESSVGTVSQKDSIKTLIDVLKKEGFWKKMNLN